MDSESKDLAKKLFHETKSAKAKEAILRAIPKERISEFYDILEEALNGKQKTVVSAAADVLAAARPDDVPATILSLGIDNQNEINSMVDFVVRGHIPAYFGFIMSCINSPDEKTRMFGYKLCKPTTETPIDEAMLAVLGRGIREDNNVAVHALSALEGYTSIPFEFIKSAYNETPFKERLMKLCSQSNDVPFDFVQELYEMASATYEALDLYDAFLMTTEAKKAVEDAITLIAGCAGCRTIPLAFRINIIEKYKAFARILDRKNCNLYNAVDVSDFEEDYLVSLLDTTSVSVDSSGYALRYCLFSDNSQIAIADSLEKAGRITESLVEKLLQKSTIVGLTAGVALMKNHPELNVQPSIVHDCLKTRCSSYASAQVFLFKYLVEKKYALAGDDMDIFIDAIPVAADMKCPGSKMLPEHVDDLKRAISVCASITEDDVVRWFKKNTKAAMYAVWYACEDILGMYPVYIREHFTDSGCYVSSCVELADALKNLEGRIMMWSTEKLQNTILAEKSPTYFWDAVKVLKTRPDVSEEFLRACLGSKDSRLCDFGSDLLRARLVHESARSH